ncbi:MAG: hypothetical protein HY078_14640 [Elusimicrobia bacterium]|nr:hypothetical protein [Elusimicrobiota bacterium]
MSRCRGAALALLAVSLAACSHARLKNGPAKDGEVVEAEGWSPVDPKDPIGTKQRALAEAQKKAVERVVGVYISAKTRVDKAVTVDQRILANVGGYVKKYDVLSETEEGGFHKTRIRAFVLYGKVGDDLRDAGLLRPPPPPGNPKVAVMVRPAAGLARSLGDGASAAIRKALLERGFSVVDLNDPEEPSLAVKSTDTAVAASAAQRLRADLLVLGEGQGQFLSEMRLGDFRSYRARLTLRVVKAASREVVAEKTQEASAIDPSAEIAASKAMENAGQLAGETLAAELLSSLKSRQSVLVRVAGFTGLDKVHKLAEDVRGYPGVASVSFSGYLGDSAALVVSTDDMTGEEVGALLMRLPDHRFRIVSLSPYEVSLEGS